MTAITHVYNFTVRTTGQNDAIDCYNWHDHIEVNHSCEIALDRIYRWHNQAGSIAIDLGEIVLKQQDTIFYSLLNNRINDDSHAMATFKVFATDKQAQDKAYLTDIFQTLLKDYNHRISKLS